jgi:hypothetical protein
VPKPGIFYYHTLGNNAFSNRLDRRFVHDASAAHCREIRRRVIPTIRHLGTRERAAMHHQINPLAAHEANVITTRSGKRFQNAPGVA